MFMRWLKRNKSDVFDFERDHKEINRDLQNVAKPSIK